MDLPKMGDTVIYLHPGSADGKYPPMESPAIVQKVHDTVDGVTPLDLCVFSNSNGIFFGKSVTNWRAR